MNFSHKKNHNALNIVKKRKIKILLNEPKNNECFECSNIYPEYISLNNGIFICKDCASNHAALPKSISNIIKNNLNELTLRNIQYLSLGGNRKLTEFITTEFPNLKNFSPIYFYQTNAMDYYRRCLQYLIEGGVRPVKPDRNKAYELVAQIYIQSGTKMSSNNNYDGNYIKLSKNPNANGSNIKCDSYIKINGNTMYPKIKPIVGTKNDCRFTRSLSRHLEKNELTNNTSNYKNLNNTSNIWDNAKNKVDSFEYIDDLNDLGVINDVINFAFIKTELKYMDVRSKEILILFPAIMKMIKSKYAWHFKNGILTTWKILKYLGNVIIQAKQSQLLNPGMIDISKEEKIKVYDNIIQYFQEIVQLDNFQSYLVSKKIENG